VIGHLDLPPSSAAALGAPIELFRTVQLAVTTAQENGIPLGLPVGGTRADNVECLGLTPADVDALAEEARQGQPAAAPAEWLAPEQAPLLRDLLRSALELRRRREDQTVARLESDVDDLHRALREQRISEDERLRTHKLSSLAELAAGAGHEINNPLAVISGQAQYLLNHEPDPARQQSLHTIIRQAQRIHQILTELLQFARPPRPELRTLDVGQLVHDVSSSLAELAEQRHVRLDCVRPVDGVQIQGDARQLGTALRCMLRNAIEAAPADGWAGLRLDGGVAEQWQFVVEDNGSGPSPAQSEHLFDPFYSGRHAGRGRGLGLPTAWQLARNHGGEVRYNGHEAGITRFVLSLPRLPEPTPGPAVPATPGDLPSPSQGNGDESPQNGQIHVHCGP
jgi:two-component system NtrC family sensor kinase